MAAVRQFAHTQERVYAECRRFGGAHCFSERAARQGIMSLDDEARSLSSPNVMIAGAVLRPVLASVRSPRYSPQVVRSSHRSSQAHAAIAVA